MSGSRDAILRNIRSSLKRGRIDPKTEAGLRARVAAHRRNLIPARAAALDRLQTMELFVAMAEEVQATVTRLSSPSAVAGEVARYLAAENLPAELVMAPDRSLDAIPWAEWPLLQIRRGRFRALPLANGWTAVRDLPAPEGRSFQSLWAERQKTGAAK